MIIIIIIWPNVSKDFPADNVNAHIENILILYTTTVQGRGRRFICSFLGNFFVSFLLSMCIIA